MKASYSSEKMERNFQDRKGVNRKYGSGAFDLLSLRINQLENSENFEELLGLPGKWEPLKGNRWPCWSVRLNGGWRLIVKPSPTPADKNVNWKLFSSAVLVEIVDYH